MHIAEDWSELMYELHCYKSSTAKRQFRDSIRKAFGGLCIYCRCRRADTIDHLKPRNRGGSNLRSNLVPCCLKCNHSKGSESWLTWYEQQDFYSEVAKELIEEWIDNKHLELKHEERLEYRAEICSHKSEVRGISDEQASSRESCVAAIKIKDGAEEWCTEYVKG